MENSPEIGHLAHEPTIEKVWDDIKYVANRNATGPSGLPTDNLKAFIFKDSSLDSQTREFLAKYIHKIVI
eukprot:5810464-Ditylum_brightwellii.AAC.1